jgi:hypothetical protein
METLVNSRLSENLKATLEKAERYVLVTLSSSVAFAVLSLPKANTGASSEAVKWTLLGFSLDFDPRLALLILYMLYFFSCIFADNMLLHVKDLAKRLKKVDPGEVHAVMTHPTILTVSPIGQFVVTVIPAVLVCLGLARSHFTGTFALPGPVWWTGYGFGGLLGLGVYARVWQCVAPYLKDIQNEA